MDNIYVKMFGGFEISYKGEVLSLGRSRSTKSLKLLQILLAYRDTGISRKELTDCLFHDEDVLDVSNSLRVNKHRLQERLVKAGLPDVPYVIIKKNTYYWNEEVPVETDVQKFNTYINEAKATDDVEEKAELLYKACAFYRGEFLEELGAEEWILVRSVQLKQAYDTALKNLIAILREEHRYESMLEVSSNASRIYPYDDWQVVQIESLLALRRKREAMDVYHKMAQIYHEDLMIKFPEEITKQIKEFKPRQKDVNEIEKNIINGLRDMRNDPGAISLSLSGFVDALCILKKAADERKRRLFITAYVLKDDENITSSISQIQDISENLAEVLKRYMRNVDIYTNVNQSQFLVLTYETTQEQCEMIAVRIKGRFRDKCGEWMGNIESYVIPVDEQEVDSEVINDYIKKLESTEAV